MAIRGEGRSGLRRGIIPNAHLITILKISFKLTSAAIHDHSATSIYRCNFQFAKTFRDPPVPEELQVEDG